MLTGMKMGKNMQSILINRGWLEMIKFGLTFGTTTKPFLGTAGIGDLIASCTSENSRNLTFGKRLAQGESIEEIFKTTYEIVEHCSNTTNFLQNFNIRQMISGLIFYRPLIMDVIIL